MGTGSNKRERLNAFEGVVAAFEAPLLRYAARIANNPSHAQDIVQNAFIKMIKSWKGEYSPTPELSAWLYKAVHNEAVDMIRSEERRRRLHEEHGAEALAQPSQAETEPDEAGIIAAEALNSLSPREREVVVLKVYEEKKYREIAEITGMTVDNVGVTLHVALRKLSAILGGKGVRL